jgi:glucokinase
VRYGFGVDVGGTTVKIGLFDETGTLLARKEIATRTENEGAQILPDIARAVDSFGIAPVARMGIGIGVPGPVDDAGVVYRCVNLHWGVFDLREALGDLTQSEIRAGNDANLAALGEFWQGGGAGCSSAIFVTLGTGVGGGIILDGKVLNGAHGVGGEIGHIVVRAPDRAPCTCGKCGCVEQYASANGIVRVTRERLARCDTPSVLRGIEDFSCKDVFDAARSGDDFAAQTLEIVFDYLGEALASACCVCDPQRIILGGGVSRAGEILRDGVERHFRMHMFHACKDTEITLAKLGGDAGMYGAFRLLY